MKSNMVAIFLGSITLCYTRIPFIKCDKISKYIPICILLCIHTHTDTHTHIMYMYMASQ